MQSPVKIRWQHGRVAADKVSELFERLKPAPETNLLAASTISLALVHHLVGEGSEATATDKAFALIKNALGRIPHFERELRITPAEFFSRLTQYWMEYKAVVRDLDLREGKGIGDYVAAIRGGTLSLPTYLIRLIDLSMDPMEAEKGLPEDRRLTDAERGILSTKLLDVHFPVADTLGFGTLANDLRRNGVHMSQDEARRELLRKEERWQMENQAALRDASLDLKKLVTERLKLLGDMQLMQALRDNEGGLTINTHPPRMKTPEACVLKLAKKDEIHDRIAVRLVFHCTADEAHAIGRALHIRMYEPGAFAELQVDDHYAEPAPSGFTAYHINGKNKRHKVRQVEGHGEADGIPCEVQVIDKRSFDEAQCGRWARLSYKSGDEAAKDGTLLEVFYGLLGPFLKVIRNGGLVVEPYVPRVLREEQHETFRYSIYAGGELQAELESTTPISGIDAVVAATGAAVEAAVRVGAQSFGPFDILPPGSMDVHVTSAGGALAPGLCKDLIAKAAIGTTRRILLKAKNGNGKHKKD